MTVSDLPIVLEFPFTFRIFLYVLGIAMVAAAIIGVFPALRVSKGNFSRILHEGGRSSTGRSQGTRSVLVAAQVASSVALLIVAGLFVRKPSKRPAFRSRFRSSPRPERIARSRRNWLFAGARRDFYRQLLTRTPALPGVQSASLAMLVRSEIPTSREIKIPGRVSQRGEELTADINGSRPTTSRP